MTKPSAKSSSKKQGHNEPHRKGEIMSTELKYYIVGCLIIGLPMAITSATIYLSGDSFDKSKWNSVLRTVRCLLHPLSFHDLRLVTSRNDWDNYGGLIVYIIGADRPTPSVLKIVTYVVMASLCWPLRCMMTAIYVLGRF